MKAGTDYTCEICKETFERICDDSVAFSEFIDEWPDHVGDTMMTVCDDCYKKATKDEAPCD